MHLPWYFSHCKTSTNLHIHTTQQTRSKRPTSTYRRCCVHVRWGALHEPSNTVHLPLCQSILHSNLLLMHSNRLSKLWSNSLLPSFVIFLFFSFLCRCDSDSCRTLRFLWWKSESFHRRCAQQAALKRSLRAAIALFGDVELSNLLLEFGLKFRVFCHRVKCLVSASWICSTAVVIDTQCITSLHHTTIEFDSTCRDCCSLILFLQKAQRQVLSAS